MELFIAKHMQVHKDLLDVGYTLDEGEVRVNFRKAISSQFPALHCQYCYDLLNRVFDPKTSDCRRSQSSHSSSLAIHTSLLAFHHPYGQPPATPTNTTDAPLVGEDG